VSFHVISSMNDLIGLRDIFRVRFPGLIDASGSVRNAYLPPNMEAPYPQDCIIDQQGNIAYWESEYDVQRSLKVIERLLNGKRR
jgi:hypothetical protein